MICAFCGSSLVYVHGHATCGQGSCPMFGVNQAECCSGETAACGPLTAEVRAPRFAGSVPSARPDGHDLTAPPAPTDDSRGRR